MVKNFTLKPPLFTKSQWDFGYIKNWIKEKNLLVDDAMIVKPLWILKNSMLLSFSVISYLPQLNCGGEIDKTLWGWPPLDNSLILGMAWANGQLPPTPPSM